MPVSGKALTLCLATLMAPAPAAGSPQVRESGVAQDVLVERAVWPVVVEPESCLSMAPDQWIVTEDGERARVTAIDPGPPARIHAILVDNSASMEPHLGRFKDAAIEYVRSCPDEEPAMVSSFANNVVLEASLSADRAGQIAAIRGLALGNQTALLDALYYMMRYVEPRPERKIVIVFTDTFDNASLGRHDDERLLALARGISDLSVFVIHVKNKRQPFRNARSLLERLATETGGAYFVPRRGQTLVEIFRDIRTRLDHQAFVTYSPLPFGEGRLDLADHRSYHLREVDVRVQPGSGCRVVSAGPPTRLVGKRPPIQKGIVAAPPSEGDALPPRVLDGLWPPGRTWRILEKLQFPPPATWPALEHDVSSFYVVEPQTRLFGSTLDIVEEKGARYDARQLAEQGRYVTRLEAAPAFATRGFTVALPPLWYIKERIRSPADVMLYLMDSGAFTIPPSGLESSARHPLLIHGQTWLEIRRYLAEAMYRAREDYRFWADARLDSEHRSNVDHMLAEYRRENAVPEEDADRLRQTLLDHVARPGPESTHALLAEWLGDVPALTLALDLQTRIANRMLGRETAYGQQDEFSAAAFSAAWAHLQAWFPPPTHVRVLAPLVPAYDPQHDIFGFYRVVLPRFRAFALPADPVPEHPFGIEIIDWLLSDPELAASLRADAEVTDMSSIPVEIAAASANETSDAPDSFRSQWPHGAFETSVGFSIDGGDNSFSVIALHIRTSSAGKDFDLSCLRFSGKTTEIARRVVSLISAAGLRCDKVPVVTGR